MIKHKYGAKSCAYKDKKFPSKLERDCYIVLKDMEKKGLVLFTLTQVGIDLPGGFRHFVDFLVFTPTNVLFIESKGRDLQQGRMKRLQSAELLGIEIHVAKKATDIPLILEKNA